MKDMQAVTQKLLKQQIQQRNFDQINNKESYGQEFVDQVTENAVIGVYNGKEFEQIRHNRADSFGGEKHKNQIVSQSKIIIPRGIINFKKGPSHSLSIDRNPLLVFKAKNFHKEGKCVEKQITVTFNEVEHSLPNMPDEITDIQNKSLARSTFMIEPRDESLMRKKKVREILQSFQVQDEDKK